ncbi:MAG: Uup, transporter ATPase, ATP-binding cassette, subfamily er 3 [Candidatus Saccharibacteria bacterium]|nr:Uup, transporter ATPase, ATP-binding cassette, subfamily er 3 [Candidatus Saccharibacteria bacterium]
MILNVDITEKSFGDKQLYHELAFTLAAGEKVGLIGRNGTGKSTLLHMITGDDRDYQGDITLKRGTILIASRQEHHGHEDKTVLDYIQGDLPEFAELHHIITTYPATMGDNQRKLQRYSDALERFSQLNYFQTEDELTQMFADYQLPAEKLEVPLDTLSGGQKRMVELVKVQRAKAHLALIDEPTNHMDYRAKESFIKWLKAAQEAIVVITHDRDVLREVDKIIEIRNGQAYTFRGNYEQYLSINKNQVTAQVNEYDLTQRRISNLGEDLIRFRRMKEKAHDPGTVKRFKSQEMKVAAELRRLSAIKQPSFWIDRENADDLNPKMTNAYQKYKAKNIRMTAKTDDSRSSQMLVQAHELSLGYGDSPLFAGVDFTLREGERIRLHGRNGAGKTTLVNAIMAKVHDLPQESNVFGGTLAVAKELALGLYEQEIDPKYLPMTLHDGIEQSFRDKGLPLNDQKIKQLMGEYLFNPASDGDVPINMLSGGQKARFQLIRMLMNDPSILILDEPTNHLDLPSIEELENTLSTYQGAVIYISHDSYFAKKVGGETVQIGTAT